MHLRGRIKCNNNCIQHCTDSIICPGCGWESQRSVFGTSISFRCSTDRFNTMDEEGDTSDVMYVFQLELGRPHIFIIRQNYLNYIIYTKHRINKDIASLGRRIAKAGKVIRKGTFTGTPRTSRLDIGNNQPLVSNWRCTSPSSTLWTSRSPSSRRGTGREPCRPEMQEGLISSGPD